VTAQLSLDDVIERRARMNGRLDLWEPTDEQWRSRPRRAGEVVSLDNWPPGQKPPRARRRDPESSHETIDALEASGAHEAQLRQTLDAVLARPGLTSRELAEAFGLDRHLVGRRAADLAKRLWITRSKAPREDVRLWPAGSQIPRGSVYRDGAMPAAR
jgi:hypothetical protein